MHDSTAKNRDECWKDSTGVDNIQYLKYLVESMPKRVQEVINREGWTSKYQDMSSAFFMAFYSFFRIFCAYGSVS